jgi:hypothetical protein
MKKLIFPPPVATKTVYTIWKQIVNLIPPQIVLEAAAETDMLSRSFTPWSHQLTRTESLNGVELLESFGANGTARGGICVVEVAKPMYLQAFLPFDAGPMGQHG